MDHQEPVRRTKSLMDNATRVQIADRNGTVIFVRRRDYTSFALENGDLVHIPRRVWKIYDQEDATPIR